MPKIPYQVIRILNPDRQPDQRFRDAHFSPARRTHFPIDGLRDRYRQRTVIPQMARRNHQFQPVEEVKAINPISQLDTHQRAVTLEQLTRQFVLRVVFKPRIKNLGHFGVRRQKPRQRQRIARSPLHAQRQRLGTSSDTVCRLGCQRCADITQALLADLLHAPH